MKSLSALLLAILMSISANCLSINGILHIPWKTIQEQVSSHQDSQNLTENFTFNNLTVSTAFGALALPTVSAQVIYGLNPILLQNEQLSVSTRQLQINLEIPAVTIQRQLGRVIGGVQVIVDLKASCLPIRITQTAAVAAGQVRWREAGESIQAKLSNVRFSWPENSWSLSPIQCTGPIGFADLIQQELVSLLSDPTKFAAQIQNYMQNSINERVTALLNRTVAPHFLQLQNTKYRYQLQPQQRILGSGMLFQVLVSNDGDGLLLPPPKTMLSGNDLPVLSSAQPSLVFGQVDFQEFLKDSLPLHTVQTQLNNLEGFAKLLRSRFFQFFVWPDLMNFPKTTRFVLNTQIVQKPLVSLNLKKKWEVDLQLASWITAARDGAVWNYLQIRNHLQGQLSLTVDHGQMQLVPKLSKLSSQFSFGVEYAQRFHPRKSIDKSLIENSVKESVFAKTHNLQIPNFQLDGGSAFSIDKVQFGTKSEMIFEFSLVASKPSLSDK